jgi:uncharacterized protein
MGRSTDGSGDQALQALDAYLASGRGPVGRRGLSDLDGFLAALAIGPGTIMQAEWLPVIWGQEQPGFENLDEANAILSAIIGRFNMILRQLDRAEFAPLFQESPTGQSTAADWCQGFLDGIRLRLDSWDALFRDGERSDLLYPILALCRDYALCRNYKGGSLLGLDPEAEEKFLEQASELVPACAVAIYRYWRDQEPQPDARLQGAAEGGRAVT